MKGPRTPVSQQRSSAKARGFFQSTFPFQNSPRRGMTTCLRRTACRAVEEGTMLSDVIFQMNITEMPSSNNNNNNNHPRRRSRMGCGAPRSAAPQTRRLPPSPARSPAAGNGDAPLLAAQPRSLRFSHGAPHSGSPTSSTGRHAPASRPPSARRPASRSAFAAVLHRPPASSRPQCNLCPNQQTRGAKRVLCGNPPALPGSRRAKPKPSDGLPAPAQVRLTARPPARPAPDAGASSLSVWLLLSRFCPDTDFVVRPLRPRLTVTARVTLNPGPRLNGPLSCSTLSFSPERTLLWRRTSVCFAADVPPAFQKAHSEH